MPVSIERNSVRRVVLTSRTTGRDLLEITPDEGGAKITLSNGARVNGFQRLYAATARELAYGILEIVGR